LRRRLSAPAQEPKPAQLNRKLLELMGGLLRLREEARQVPRSQFNAVDNLGRPLGCKCQVAHRLLERRERRVRSVQQSRHAAVTRVYALAQIGELQIGGQVSRLAAQGLDPFLLLVLPRACALAIACFTLGIMFVLAALLSGFVVGSLFEAVRISIWSFFDRVLLAMHVRDFVVFPAKMIVIGLLIAQTASLTGLTATAQDEAARLLPRAFVRGVVAVLLANLALSLAV
jgi:Permease MlaE